MALYVLNPVNFPVGTVYGVFVRACVRDIELEATKENFRKMEAEEEEKFS